MLNRKLFLYNYNYCAIISTEQKLISLQFVENLLLSIEDVIQVQPLLSQTALKQSTQRVFNYK